MNLLALLPPIIAIVLALLTREVLLSLVIAIFIGACIVTGSPVEGFTAVLNKYLVGALTDSWNISILLFCLIIGGLIGIINKNGGTKGLASLLVKRAVSTKSALFSTWLLGLAIFFDDYANSLIVGNSMRAITDRMGISREKLAYIVDSTAAPISSMALISTWVGMELGLIQEGLEKFGLNMGAYDVFLRSIPFRFYSLLALFFVLVIIFTGKDFGPMLAAERKARKKASDDQVEELSSKWYNAILPIGTVIVATIIGLYQNGGGFEGASIREAYSNADASVVLLWASFLGVVVAWIQSLFQKISVAEISESFVEGVKSMAVPAMILSLAWTLSGINSDLGTAEVMVELIGENVPVFLIPTMMFIVPAIVAFSTGTSWGTNAIVMPIAIELAFLTGGAELIIPTIGAVLTGAVMGDHLSPVSDTTIMSSMASGCNHISHVKTQIPYALTVAGVAIVFGFVPAGLGMSPLISLPLASIVLYGIVKVFGQASYEAERQVEQAA
ncbi:Na+/H+ antiporter NhaC family protein [Acidaminobacter sp. JC074]|uniref:Na+/H+ antiporter NhaC family protein n=1 Tax=Acidaminobacter sp. JC074 TaxID=2530199 RepID=UPI001F11493A|nr:Na+/H+ antiporter NhaC family protein [Acidaminobacter sp. JC074]MCH4891116.1 Na+/H+ antiporter NhaC family protein [Acidaminobacter sp. JC074]